jgi:hypothetical protein
VVLCDRTRESVEQRLRDGSLPRLHVARRGRKVLEVAVPLYIDESGLLADLLLHACSERDRALIRLDRHGGQVVHVCDHAPAGHQSDEVSLGGGGETDTVYLVVKRGYWMQTPTPTRTYTHTSHHWA